VSIYRGCLNIDNTSNKDAVFAYILWVGADRRLLVWLRFAITYFLPYRNNSLMLMTMQGSVS